MCACLEVCEMHTLSGTPKAAVPEASCEFSGDGMGTGAPPWVRSASEGAISVFMSLPSGAGGALEAAANGWSRVRLPGGRAGGATVGGRVVAAMTSSTDAPPEQAASPATSRTSSRCPEASLREYRAISCDVCMAVVTWRLSSPNLSAEGGWWECVCIVVVNETGMGASFWTRAAPRGAC